MASLALTISMGSFSQALDTLPSSTTHMRLDCRRSQCVRDRLVVSIQVLADSSHRRLEARWRYICGVSAINLGQSFQLTYLRYAGAMVKRSFRASLTRRLVSPSSRAERSLFSLRKERMRCTSWRPSALIDDWASKPGAKCKSAHSSAIPDRSYSLRKDGEDLLSHGHT